MKKLTAGILASLIGLVSANSAEAAVASTKYVDEGLATKQQKLTVQNFKKDGTGKFVTGVNVDENGNVTFTSENQAEAVYDSTWNPASTNAVQAQVIAGKIAEMASSTVEANKVVKSVTQENGKITPTYGQVTGADIASETIQSANIADGTIATADIADSAVTTTQIANDAVTSAKIANGTIVDDDIANVAMGKVTGLDTALAGKQAKLTEANQGTNVDLTFDAEGNLATISATDTTYTAGAGIKLNGTEFSADVTTAVLNEELAKKQNTFNWGTNLTYDPTSNTVSATDTTYTTGTADASGLTKLYTTTGTATDGTMTQAAITTELGNKQGNLTAGNGITLDAAGNIAAKAGTGITIDANGISADNQLDGVTKTGDAGLQVLTRDCSTGTCQYVWEEIDRTFGN
jgi:Cu/Ag efflux protein CusF